MVRVVGGEGQTPGRAWRANEGGNTTLEGEARKEEDVQSNLARIVAGSSPTLLSGSILKLAPCSSPTSRSRPGRSEGEDEELSKRRGTRRRSGEARGREEARARARAAGRREAIFLLFRVVFGGGFREVVGW